MYYHFKILRDSFFVNIQPGLLTFFRILPSGLEHQPNQQYGPHRQLGVLDFIVTAHL